MPENLASTSAEPLFTVTILAPVAREYGFTNSTVLSAVAALQTEVAVAVICAFAPPMFTVASEPYAAKPPLFHDNWPAPVPVARVSDVLPVPKPSTPLRVSGPLGNAFALSSFKVAPLLIVVRPE